MCFLSGLRLLALAGVSQWQTEDTRQQWSISRKASYTGAMMEWWVERVITYHSQPFQKQRKTQDVKSFAKTYFLNKSFISNNLSFYLQNNVFSLWRRHLEILIDTKTTTKKYMWLDVPAVWKKELLAFWTIIKRYILPLWRSDF